MRSSIFSSEREAGNASFWWLVASVGAAAILVELGAGVLPSVMFWWADAVRQQMASASTIQRCGGDGPSILFVGNSLMVEGLAVPEVKEALGERYSLHFLGIEQTQYFDWYFGLRKLVRAGARPAVVIVATGVEHLIASGTRGAPFAHEQMDLRDLLAVREDLQLDNTAFTNMAFANVSEWLGRRALIRGWILARVVPNAAQLTGRLPAPRPPTPDPEVLGALAQTRIVRLRELTDSSGASLILTIPPSRSGIDRTSVVEAAGARSGVPVVVPFRPLALEERMFSDGYHLNAQGASVFTQQLLKALQIPLATAATRCQDRRVSMR